MKQGFRLFLLVCITGFLTGCASGKEVPKDRSKVTFTVVEERQLPPELLQVIEQNKKNEMRMTYQDGKELYLIRGYGEQKTGGYSISVAECTEDDKTVYFDTRLLGPKDAEQLKKEASFPYLAVRIEAREKEVKIT